jgi:O-antigen ligase
MERVYRWVAAGQMVADKPMLGFGPGTFTKFYKSYTVTGFTTYVSYNDEGSGIHCYYLMTLVEQGWAGVLFFVALVFFVLIKGEIIYHQTTDPARRRVVLTVLLTAVIIDGLNLMNDVVETDKIGSFFFLCMAILVNADLANQQETPMANDQFNG